MDISLQSAGALSVLHLTGRLVVGAEERELIPLRNVIGALIERRANLFQTIELQDEIAALKAQIAG